MLREMHLISNRAMTLGALLLLGTGILLAFDPLLAHRWFAVLLALEPETLRPVAPWSSVAWHALALMVGLYTAGAAPGLLSRALRAGPRPVGAEFPGARFGAPETVQREEG